MDVSKKSSSFYRVNQDSYGDNYDRIFKKSDTMKSAQHEKQSKKPKAKKKVKC